MVIAVYCSAKDSIAESYKQLGMKLGKRIAQSGNTLLYGGATGGLMSAVSAAVQQEKGEIIGVIPELIRMNGRQADNCTHLYVVKNMAERKQKMRELADVFVCLPGSYGTLDEMMDVISAGVVGEHKKPLYILNYNGFYNLLQQQIERMKQECFILASENYKPIFVPDMNSLLERLSL